jgi:hypothetical protein
MSNLLPTYEVKLEVNGKVLKLGSGFTKRYAVICRNWHIGWLGIDLPLQEVPEEKCDKHGTSWTYYPPVSDVGFWARMSERSRSIRKAVA